MTQTIDSIDATLQDQAHQRLRSVFGYESFRGNQWPVINAVMQGHNALVLMPTGGGKSLCYQIPALLGDGLTVVVSPLIALMQDQVAALKQQGVGAAYLNSSLDAATQRDIEQQVQEQSLDLLYVAPERLLSEPMLALLDSVPLSLFAIDEAHCVSQWGHDFRPEYMRLDVLRQRFPGVPRLALTATADTRTQDEIRRQLLPDGGETFVASFDRPNLCYRVGLKNSPRQQLLAFIQEHHQGEAGIVYCMSRKKTEALASWLDGQGIAAVPYHAGLPSQTRQAHQERFLREDGLVVVATVAFGMGIDKPDVRFVAHLDLPKSIEAYYQETGRAGRDGLPADAWMVYGLQDVFQVRQMLAQSTAPDAQKSVERQRLEALLAYSETTHCRHQALVRYFGQDHPGDCGQCDNCLQPPATWDASEPARKALSCVYRTGQRFGAGHVIDVLIGRDTDRVQQLRHHELSTFGIGNDLSPSAWQSVFRQLLALGYLQSDPKGFGGIQLAPECRALLRGEEPLNLRQDLIPPARQRKTRHTGANGMARSATEQPAGPEWEALRDLRKTLADEAGVPPFMIFHDATLREMLSQRPTTHEQFANIPGVGQAKLDRFGDAFVAVIQGFSALPD